MKASATVALLIAASSLAPLALADYRDDPKTELLHQKLIREYAFTPQDLVQVDAALAQAERQPQLVQAERQNKEVTTPLWDSYRAIHVFPKQISNGLRVLRENQQWFDRAEAEYGVPPVISAAILGVETKYGSFTGRNRVLDALVTQGYEHPTRSKFFFNELAAYFAFCRDFGRMPLDIKGSYAGAVGYLGFNGDMDIAIAIRTAVIKDGYIHVQAGAGIVADSDPDAEWTETQNKAKAAVRAAELAENGLDTRFE